MQYPAGEMTTFESPGVLSCETHRELWKPTQDMGDLLKEAYAESSEKMSVFGLTVNSIRRHMDIPFSSLESHAERTARPLVAAVSNILPKAEQLRLFLYTEDALDEPRYWHTDTSTDPYPTSHGYTVDIGTMPRNSHLMVLDGSSTLVASGEIHEDPDMIYKAPRLHYDAMPGSGVVGDELENMYEGINCTIVGASDQIIRWRKLPGVNPLGNYTVPTIPEGDFAEFHPRTLHAVPPKPQAGRLLLWAV